MADLRISELQPLAGGDLVAGDLLAIADLSASETKKITVIDLVGRATTLIADATIPAAKVLFGSGTIPGSALTTGAIDAVHLAGKAVTAAKLADESTVDLVTTLPASGAFVGQIALDTNVNKIYCWDGSSWVSIKAAGSVNTVVGGSSGIVNITVTTSGDEVTISTTLDNTSGASQFLAGPTGGAGAVAYRTITANDLPTATNSAKGAVIVNGNGLTITGDTIQIDNTVTANSTKHHLVQYDANGLVTGGRGITSLDLPPASNGTVGAVYPVNGLSVAVDGAIGHINTISPGTFTKITVDAQGHATTGTSLSAIDIPDISADKLTTGTLPAGRIGARSITQQMMGDYAFAYIQESVPSAGVGAHPIGMIWLQESTGQVSVWNGNSWMKTGASTLFNRNLRYGGSYNAATGAITGVTQFGTAEGFKVGDTIPAADDKIAGLYFVASAGGSSSSLAGGAVFDPGDWLLCQGTTGGWARIDTLSGGGGGGSTVSNLDDLLDVTLTTPTTGDFLQLDNRGQWVNVSVLDEGTWT